LGEHIIFALCSPQGRRAGRETSRASGAALFVVSTKCFEHGIGMSKHLQSEFFGWDLLPRSQVLEKISSDLLLLEYYQVQSLVCFLASVALDTFFHSLKHFDVAVKAHSV
jgi:hypothetical protein